MEGNKTPRRLMSCVSKPELEAKKTKRKLQYVQIKYTKFECGGVRKIK